MSDWIIVHDLNTPEHVRINTGVLTKDNRKIYKNPEPIGFIPPKSYNKYEAL